MSLTQDTYSQDEMSGLSVHAMPERGPICPKCKTHIPQFADLSEEDEARIRKLIREDRKVLATQELKTATHCPISWAKIWVSHSGRADGIGTTAPCPYCRKPLKTALAKQCPHCKMDWHNPKNPKRLGTT